MIPTIEVRGTAYECGSQLGNWTPIHDALHQMLARYQQDITSHGGTWDDIVSRTKKYYGPSAEVFPFVDQIIKGVSSTSGIGMDDLLPLTMTEPYDPLPQRKACTDIVVVLPRRKGLISGHNNDLEEKDRNNIFGVQWSISGKPQAYTVGVGGVIASIGINKRGIGLGGNYLANKDMRETGFSRDWGVMGIIFSKTMKEAISISIDSRRASSYNNVIFQRDNLVAIEGSATQYVLHGPNDKGYYIHTNHYIDPTMEEFEGKPDYKSSLSRYADAGFLLQNRRLSLFTGKDMKKILRNHGPHGTYSDLTICRHGKENEGVTIFSSVVDTISGTVELANGNPCVSKYDVAYRF